MDWSITKKGRAGGERSDPFREFNLMSVFMAKSLKDHIEDGR